MNQEIRTITGRLGKNPVLYHRETSKGRFPVAKFSLAVDTFKSGQKETVWVQCSAWEKRADLCMKNLRKGAAVQLHGFLTKEGFQGKNGYVEYWHFNVIFVSFLEKKATVGAPQGAVEFTQADPFGQMVLPGVTKDPF